MTAFGKDDFMYPMSLLCHRRPPPLVIARMGCQGLRVGRRSEKCTMRMVVQIFCSRVCTCPAKRMIPGRALHLGRVLLCWRTLSRSTFRSTLRSNADVHSFCAAHHRCRRSIPAQLHPGHGEELFHRLLLRETRVETLATRPREGTVPVIRRPLRVHCSGFAPFPSPFSFLN